jgi:hypothetical protein
MTDDLTLKERAALLGLMTAPGELLNTDFRDRIGFSLDGKTRLHLVELGLITSEKRNRTNAHQLTERGRQWCRVELSAARPPRAGYLGGALYALLANLPPLLERRGLRADDLFGAPAADLDVEGRVRAAYAKLAQEPRDWVRLADLRSAVDAPRGQVDDVIKTLSRARRASVIPEQNQQVLTRDDEAAAVRIGGENKHLISIE